MTTLRTEEEFLVDVELRSQQRLQELDAFGRVAGGGSRSGCAGPCRPLRHRCGLHGHPADRGKHAKGQNDEPNYIQSATKPTAWLSTRAGSAVASHAKLLMLNGCSAARLPVKNKRNCMLPYPDAACQGGQKQLFIATAQILAGGRQDGSLRVYLPLVRHTAEPCRSTFSAAPVATAVWTITTAQRMRLFLRGRLRGFPGLVRSLVGDGGHPAAHDIRRKTWITRPGTCRLMV